MYTLPYLSYRPYDQTIVEVWSNDSWSIDVLPSELTAQLAQMEEQQLAQMEEHDTSTIVWSTLKVTGSIPGSVIFLTNYVCRSFLQKKGISRFADRRKMSVMEKEFNNYAQPVGVVISSACCYPASTELLSVDVKGNRTPPPQFWSNDSWSIDVLPSELTANRCSTIVWSHLD